MTADGLRYVVLRHEGIPEPHFDFMFETSPGSLLATWRVPEWPLLSPVSTRRLVDHRREYLTFEGKLSGDRGQVSRIAEGPCLLIRGPQDHWWVVDINVVQHPGIRLTPVGDDWWILEPFDK